MTETMFPGLYGGQNGDTLAVRLLLTCTHKCWERRSGCCGGTGDDLGEDTAGRLDAGEREEVDERAGLRAFLAGDGRRHPKRWSRWG